ncbi:MAG TPA: hypothetical protein PK993_04795 [Clostridia bacterium]|nr:hypothetical protein [Clostridia bacterium]
MHGEKTPGYEQLARIAFPALILSIYLILSENSLQFFGTLTEEKIYISPICIFMLGITIFFFTSLIL